MGTTIQPFNPYDQRLPPNYPPPPLKRYWWRGFLVAALIHWVIILLLLWSWTSYQESRTVTKAQLCVVIDKDPIIHELRLPSACEPAPPKPKSKPKPRPAPKPAPPRPQVQPPAPVVRSAPQSADDANRFLQSYIEKLRARIRARRVYPPPSIAQREEGNVLVSFDLVRDGTIRNIRMVKSSGYPLLDDNAVHLLQKISPFEPIPETVIEGLGKNTFSFQIPIEYRLSEVL